MLLTYPPAVKAYDIILQEHRNIIIIITGNKLWQYYGFQLVETKTMTTPGYTGNIEHALATSDGTIYLLKVRRTKDYNINRSPILPLLHTALYDNFHVHR